MNPELPLGEQVTWAAARRPQRAPLRGTHVLLAPVEPDTDAQPLYEVSHPPDGDPTIWTYLPDGPYASAEQLQGMLAWAASAQDAVYYAIAPLPNERPLGLAAFLRITPEFGVIEERGRQFAADLKAGWPQRTSTATVVNASRCTP